ncbi:unnamed protein product [Coffea canephora]|uniref:Stress-related protein n=2 Tax=Coffea TaxID=13442 RepID=A0A068VBV0_COFCA|nr:stress-related protein-like [Coffea arabica]CDP18044.1 unnamed protein product [Coffea canephora]
MAETDPKPQNQMEGSEEQRLKYLEFVQAAVLHLVLCAASVYAYAKDNSGPLKPGVQRVEGTVRTVVGPVYNKFHDVPFALLKLVDRKVDESVSKMENYVPPLLKKAPAAARTVASEVKSAGVMETASGLAKNAYVKYEPAARELYTKYEPVAEHYAVSAWRSLNKLPLFPQVAQAVAPAAGYCSEKYNQTVQQTAEKGYRAASYLPLVPTEKIAKIFTTEEAEPRVGGGDSAVEAH